MNNYVQEGRTLTLIAPRAVAAGVGILVGSIFGIAKAAAAQGANVETQIVGVVDHAKAAGAVTQGQLIYWDNAAFVMTTTAGGNKPVGAATQAAAGADVTLRVRLTGQVS